MELSAKDTEEYVKELFFLIDTNRSGVISYSEIKKVMDLCGIDVSDEEAAQMVRALDADDSGRIDFAEFYAFYSTHVQPKLLEVKVREVFNALDTHGDNAVSVRHLHRLMESMSDGISVDEFQSLLSSAKVYPTRGTLTFAEFHQLIQYSQSMKDL
ncbi:hypothetical protein ADUPG1_012115 [Aduncisulcus paluster]|uniref:EF-hand domain-containing protein n=1 Tax=Aduncisulcus paluster TaxID=2918883 RepID=A0ABQ5JYE4_9EUKA|nr:hypothetical protein ADUPG1_012115 [Aduncisulcus paluster]|eukprot:gnl/Carplike_NY0171/1588_a2147_812.p1 GENE.gnl/Carplike_NY0171/1588_a2147_812~~gnl/Carplike_NY0171/1588_a2147_812.p1  ORF type:complete len:156 (-),score=26.46 gnl/Carplike_NY0171/1588_a2147_812:35-502(-)